MSPTTQETAIYDALTNGDHEQLADLEAAATTAPYQPPDPVPEDWEPGPDQWRIDHAAAMAHYQADHEPPESERIENTQAHVEDENAD